MSDEPKTKSRVSYDKDIKAQAKSQGIGLATIGIINSDGTRVEMQGVCNAIEGRFLKWAGAIVFSRTGWINLERLMKRWTDGQNKKGPWDCASCLSGDLTIHEDRCTPFAWWQVSCNKCGAAAARENTEFLAITAWNVGQKQ